jgi:hypothetical protein
MSVSAALKVLAPTKNGYVMAKPVLAKELTFSSDVRIFR